MDKMKAFARTGADSMDVEMITVPIPAVAEDEVLVAIEAFGVGIHDRYFIPADAQFPYVIGIEGAGRITAVGAQVTGYATGDRVVFTSSMHPKGGCVFRGHPASDSESIRPGIPILSGH